MKVRVISRVGEVNYDMAKVFHKPYNITSGDVEGLFDFNQPHRAVKRVVPDGSPDGLRDG